MLGYIVFVYTFQTTLHIVHCEICKQLDQFERVIYVSCTTGCCGDIHRSYCCQFKYFGAIILSSVIGIALLIVIILTIVCWCRRRKQKTSINFKRVTRKYGTIDTTESTNRPTDRRVNTGRLSSISEQSDIGSQPSTSITVPVEITITPATADSTTVESPFFTDKSPLAKDKLLYCGITHMTQFEYLFMKFEHFRVMGNSYETVRRVEVDVDDDEVIVSTGNVNPSYPAGSEIDVDIIAGAPYQPPGGRVDIIAGAPYQPPVGRVDIIAGAPYQPPVGRVDVIAGAPYQPPGERVDIMVGPSQPPPGRVEVDVNVGGAYYPGCPPSGVVAIESYPIQPPSGCVDVDVDLNEPINQPYRPPGGVEVDVELPSNRGYQPYGPPAGAVVDIIPGAPYYGNRPDNQPYFDNQPFPRTQPYADNQPYPDNQPYIDDGPFRDDSPYVDDGPYYDYDD
ncbi:hypothetical protein ACF0H5_014026 [Mactra antiquata]